jgi:hypothetical protein
MFALMAAVAKVPDVIAKITRDSCVVHEHGPCLSAQRLRSAVAVSHPLVGSGNGA